MRVRRHDRSTAGIRAAVAIVLGIVSGGHDAAAEEQWRFRTFTTLDGLSHDIVRDVLEARDKSLWFATMGGVTRYDPLTCRYKTFTSGGSLPRQEAMALAQGAGGTIWVATQGGGVAAYNAGSWTWYTTEDGLPTDEFSSLMVDRSGRVWATPTNGGIAMFDGQSWRTYTVADGLSGGEIGRCTQLRSGGILCGTYDQPLIQRFDGRRWSQIRVDAPAKQHFYVHAVIESREGELWLATKGTGVIQGTPDAAGGYRWIVHDRSVGLASNRVGAARQASDGSLWFATSSGVSRFEPGVRRWSSFSTRDGLGANHVFAITETAGGSLWFATLGGGVSRYGPSRWRRITESPQGLASDNLTGGLLVSRDGRLWVGTDRGISILGRDGHWTSASGSSTVAGNYINHLFQSSDGAIWIGTRQGVRRLHRGRSTQHDPCDRGQSGPVHPVVKRISEDRSGRIWMATGGGVSCFHGQRWSAYTTREGLPSDRIHDIVADPDGRIWVATDNGVARLDGRRWTPFLSPKPASRTNRIYSLALQTSEKGTHKIWASGLEGVNIYDGGTWRRMPPNSWLPTGIYSRFVVATTDGSLWFAVRGLGVRRLKAGRWTTYTTADGLASDTVRDVVVKPDGTLLFATLGGGLSSYRPDRHPPQTYVGSHTSGGARGVPGSVIQGEDLVLPFSGQDVLKETRTEDLLFSYRVDRGTWSSFSPSTRAWLAGLKPGPHLFEVRAMDRDLNVDPTPARHRFRVLRPWWAQPWLIGLVGLSLMLLIYALIRITRAISRERSAVLKEQATVNERRQFVRLASHELRKPLARMAHRSEFLALPATLEQRDKVAEYAEAIVNDSNHLSRLVETLLEQARIQEGGLQLALQDGDLNKLVQKLVGELAESSERQPGPGPVPRTTSEPLIVRYDPFYLPLALRNLLDNAFKYGGGIDAVELECRIESGRAAVTVSDRGPGIAEQDRQRIFEPFFRGKNRPEHGGFGLGLSFARDIARAHGGDLELLEPEGEGEGATFRLWLPLEKEGGVSFR